MLREVLPLLLAFLILLILALHLSPREESEKTEYPILLDENLRPLARLPLPPPRIGERVLIGKTERGYVYVPAGDTYTPRFVDRFSFYLGKLQDAKIPIEWWMEFKGSKVIPLSDAAYRGYTLVVRTPYEVVESRNEVVALYEPVYLGKRLELNDECVAVKEWRGFLVPLLMPGTSGIVDPDTKRVCRKCKERVRIRVTDEREKPLRGYFSEGNINRFSFFSPFNGSFEVCRCSRVKIYADGYRPESLIPCQDVEVTLRPLKNPEHLEGNFVFLDSTGALVSFLEGTDAQKGAYHRFHRFPLWEEGRALPYIELGEPLWAGIREKVRVPIYTILRKGLRYLYALKEGLIPVEGLLCREGFCLRTGPVPLVAFGLCRGKWAGVLESDCPHLGVKPYKRESYYS